MILYLFSQKNLERDCGAPLFDFDPFTDNLLKGGDLENDFVPFGRAFGNILFLILVP